MGPGTFEPTLNVSLARSQFPALSSSPSSAGPNNDDGRGTYIFAENAGGSQCARQVIDRIADYLATSNVQLGAKYSISQISTSRVAAGAEAATRLVNAEGPDNIAFGSSSTVLVENLARSMEVKGIFEAGDEIIITGEHESNSGPWKKLASRLGLVIKVWKHTRIATTKYDNPYAVELSPHSLAALITPRTRLVAFTGTSNLLGSALPIADIVKTIDTTYAKVTSSQPSNRKVETIVDCVALAPHRAIDVKAWGVTYAFLSCYKLYGPHISLLYVAPEALRTSLAPITHHFLVPFVDGKAGMLMPGGPGYELLWGTTGIEPYLQSLVPNQSVKEAWAAIQKHEKALMVPLLGFLTSDKARKRGVRVVGDEEVNEARVPTISFVVVDGETGKKSTSKSIVDVFDAKGDIGIRNGHMYAYTLLESLSPPIDLDDGVVRISLVHYNTVEEVQRIIKVLGEALGIDA